MHFGGGRTLLIELLHRRLKDFRRRARNTLVGCQLDPLEHPAAAHDEDVHEGAGWSHVQTEGVPIAQAHRRNLLLAIAQRLNGARGVAQMRGLFEPLGGSGFSHRVREPADELVVLALEEQLRALHGFVILLLRTDRGDAWRQAAFDVVLEARPLAVAGNHFVARANPEQPMRQPHRPAGERRRHERAGIVGAVALDVSGHEHARERFVGRQLQVGIVLVVAQPDVVPWRSLLDEVVLERERLDHRIGDDHLEAGGLVEQRIGLRVQAART